MARLLSWPVGLRANGREPLSGPRTVGAGQTQAIGGFVQTVAAPFGLWRYRFTFPPLRGQEFRRFRGWVTALHGGANATRVPFCDWDGLSLAQRGIDATSAEYKAGVPWSNDLPWSNGKNWKIGSPTVAVPFAIAAGTTEVWLDSDFWGHSLGVGDMIGFEPLHFGKYMITEVYLPGRYRIWPPLRKALALGDYATLEPVLAMRLESEEGATASRGATHSEGASVTLVEVMDADLRDYFAD